MSFYRYSLPLLPLPALLWVLVAEPGGTLALPWLLTGGLWGLDEVRQTFLLLTALLWILAGGFAVGYLKPHHLQRFWVFWVLTLVGNLGLTVSLDVASFYSFFALMTFAGYGLVVHDGTAEANRAGRVYLAMAVVGEMAILTGLLLAVQASDSLVLADLPAAVAASDRRALIILLLLTGFGVKAGLPLLHFWLPLAHPVSPTPASAVLSGAMIKAGLLGWLVTLPVGEAALPGWGNLLVILGATGALGGALLGLRQVRPKTVLAYSSISQMGLMTLLLAGALASPAQAPVIVPVLALYVLHHGLAKGCLFLSTAMALPAGRARRWLMYLLVALPGLALAGMPFTSGAMAKLAMKDVLKPAALDFSLAPHLPALMTAGAVATTLLVWRFLWTFATRARVGPNSGRLWLAWAAATAASLVAFWVLPWPIGLPDKSWFSFMLGQTWPLLWPILLGTLAVGAGWRIIRPPVVQ